MAQKLAFKPNDMVAYPAHGVGRIERIEELTIDGNTISLYCVLFEKERMTLKVPVHKAADAGLRKLASRERLKNAFATLRGRSRVRRAMWSRRAQEYEAKINSGDPVLVAEVLRDLRRKDENAEPSYSERQIYQAALERLAREVAAVDKSTEEKACDKLESVLYYNQRKKKAAAEKEAAVKEAKEEAEALKAANQAEAAEEETELQVAA